MNPFPALLVLGHRGAPDEATENTLESFVRALDAGADGVELDVQPAADGTPVVVHDATLDRTFGVAGAVQELTWPALQRLTAARLPSFQQVAAWASASGAWLNVELKHAGAEAAVVETIASHELLDRTFVSSFDERIVARAGALDTRVRRFFLTEEWNERARDRLARSGASGVCLKVDAASAMNLELLRREGIPAVIWTVNEAERIVGLGRAGVAGIISDRPAGAVAALSGAGLR